MRAGQRLKFFREQEHLTPAYLAEKIRIPVPSYYDLEDHNDLYECLSLKELVKLTQALKIQPAELFQDDHRMGAPVAPGDFASLVKTILEAIATRGITLADFESEVGWEIQNFLKNPRLAWDGNVDSLRALCTAVGLDWISILPREELGKADSP